MLNTETIFESKEIYEPIISKRKRNKQGLMEEIKKLGPEMVDYYKYVNSIKKLSLEEDKELIKRIRENNDYEAKRILIESVLKISFSTAYRNLDRYPDYTFEDLLQESNRIIVESLNHYDETRNVPFYYYVNYVLGQKFLNLNNEHSNDNFYDYKIGDDLCDYKKEFYRQNGRKPTIEEIYIFLNNIKAYKDPEDEEEAKEEVIIEDQIDFEEIIDREILKEKVSDLLDNSGLTSRERKILELRYEIDGYQPLFYEEIGKLFDISRERVRQIELRAILKLKLYIFNNKLDDFVDVSKQAKKILERYKNICLSTNEFSKLKKQDIEEIILSKTIYKLFRKSNNEYYKKSIINKMIKRLSYEDKQFLLKVYGKMLFKVNEKDLSETEKDRFFNDLVPKMKMLLDSLNSEEKVELIEISEEEKEIKQMVYQLLKEYEPRQIVVEEMYNRLSEEDKRLISRINKCMKNKQLMGKESINKQINKIINKMRSSIDEISDNIKEENPKALRINIQSK